MILERRNFLLGIIFWVLAFFFGKPLKEEEIVMAANNDGSFEPILQEQGEQLAELEKGVRITQNNPTNFNGAIVTIIDDDARPDFRTVWGPVLNATGIKIGIAVVRDWAEDGSALSVSELHELQNNGHDILCHTAHHEASYLITPERAEADYLVAKQWMKDNGFKGYEHLVYPGGLSPNSINIKNVARKHFKYAVSTQAAGDYANTPVDNWCIPRINGDGKTLEQLKSAVDYAKANGIWLVLMTHSHVLLSEGSRKMNDFIAYVRNQNVPIMSYTEAIKYKGNAIAIGEYTHSENKFFVGIDGKTNITNSYQHNTGTTVMDKPLTEYPSGSTLIQTINYLEDVFLGHGGVLTTYRTLDDTYAYQEFVPVNSTDKYTRKWDNTNTLWKSWDRLSKNMVFTSGLGLMDKPLTEYPINSATFVQVPYTFDTYLSVGGSMIVYRGDEDGYVYAEYTPFITGSVTSQEKHIRRWDTKDSVWGAWNKI